MGSEGANLLSYYAYRKGIRASGCSKAQRYVASCTEGEKAKHEAAFKTGARNCYKLLAGRL